MTDSSTPIGKLESESLDFICECVGSPRKYNEGKEAMRQWFLAKLREILKPCPHTQIDNVMHSDERDVFLCRNCMETIEIPTKETANG